VVLSLTGDDDANAMFGSPGADVLNGGVGNDTIVGRNGNDTLTGGEGNDTIWGGVGNDTINAGAGDDTIIVVGTFDPTATQPAYNAALSSLLGYTEVLGDGSAAEYAPGLEQITFGDGLDTLQVFGTVNLADLNLVDLPEAVVLNSTLILTSAQLNAITQIDLRGDTAHSIQIAGVTDDEAVEIFQAWVNQPGNQLLTSDGDTNIVISLGGVGDAASDTEFKGSTGVKDLTTPPATLLLVGQGQTYATIQAAVNAATDGDTIVVAAGTYDETVNVNKAVTILGANAGVAGHVGGVVNPARGAETVVTAFFVGAAATLDGLKVLEGAPQAGEFAGVYVSADDVTVQNMVIERTGEVGLYRGLLTTAGQEENLSVTGNLITGWRTGFFANDYGDTGTSVTGNAFVKNSTAMSIDDPRGVSVEDNLFVDNRVGVGVLGASNPGVGDTVGAGNVFTFNELTGLNQVNIFALGADLTITGTEYNDRFSGTSGNQSYIGGDGIDIAMFDGALTGSSFTIVDGKWVVTSSADGTDTLDGVEIVQGAGGKFLLVGAGGFASLEDAQAVFVDGDIILNAAEYFSVG
jgi:hypothetical protein